MSSLEFILEAAGGGGGCLGYVMVSDMFFDEIGILAAVCQGNQCLWGWLANRNL